MEKFKKGDKILFNGKIIKCDNYKNGQIIYKKDIIVYSVATSGILAETKSVERAIKHVKEHMWLELTNGDLLKVQRVDLLNSNARFFGNGRWILNKLVEKVYFYRPIKEADKKATEASHLENRPLLEQIEHWAEIGKIVEESEEIPIELKEIYRKILKNKKDQRK